MSEIISSPLVSTNVAEFLNTGTRATFTSESSILITVAVFGK